MKTTRVKVVDLSIDFDFWVRTQLEWDWDPNPKDRTIQDIQWTARYHTGMLDIWQATDPMKWADFPPYWGALVDHMYRHNVRFTSAGKGLGELGLSEDHKNAYPFFLKTKDRSQAYRSPPDAFINLDAHHDVFDENKEVHDGNWFAHLMNKWGPAVQYFQLYPKWKDLGQEEFTANKHILMNVFKLEDWSGFEEKYRVRHVFFCRSGAWVPPHLDNYFVGLTFGLIDWAGPGKLIEYGDIYKREYPDMDTAMEARMQFWQLMAKQAGRSMEELLLQVKKVNLDAGVDYAEQR